MSMNMLSQIGNQLVISLEEKNVETVRENQELFSRFMEQMWAAYQQGEIEFHVRGQALPRMMYLFATEELPQSITNPEQWPKLARELRNFMRMAHIMSTPPNE